MAERFSVQKARVGGVVDGKWVEQVGFKVVGYNGPGVNFPVESKVTMVEAEALFWMDCENAGIACPEAGWASFSDD